MADFSHSLLGTIYIPLMESADLHLTLCLQEETEGQDMQREFELGDCLDYIRTGMEAIVDDEVTKRFSAEELTVGYLLIYCTLLVLLSVVVAFSRVYSVVIAGSIIMNLLCSIL